MMTAHPAVLLIGRLLLALIFILSGSSKITGFAGTVGYMASQGLPVPQLLIIPAILIELGGGLLILIGYQTRWAALAIVLFLIPTTLIFHAFWAVPTEQVQMQMIQFQKNLAIMGGLLCLMAAGPGRYSVDKT